jgi:multidrug efflux pump subunit AcrA (membrane-fusion protein)
MADADDTTTDDATTEDDTSTDGRDAEQLKRDQAFTRRADQAARAARKATYEALGVKDEAEARKLIEDARKTREAQLSAVDKAKADADSAKADAADARREAAQLKRERTAERALATAGVSGRLLDRMTGMLLTDVGEDADDEAVKAGIEVLREEFPDAFKASAGDGGRKPPAGEAKEKGTGGKPASSSHGTVEDAMQRGRDRAAQFQGQKPDTKSA